MNAKKLGGIAILVAGLTAGRAWAASDLWLHVKVVDVEKASGVNISLPLSAVETVAGWLPDDADGDSRIRVDGRDMNVAQLRQLWRNLKDGRDAVYVNVEDSGGRVKVAKQNNTLVFNVTDPEGRHGRGEHVEMRIPGHVVDALLSGRNDQLNVQAGLRALAKDGHGDLALAKGDGGIVRIWVDADSGN